MLKKEIKGGMYFASCRLDCGNLKMGLKKIPMSRNEDTRTEIQCDTINNFIRHDFEKVKSKNCSCLNQELINEVNKKLNHHKCKQLEARRKAEQAKQHGYQL